jgi:cyclopropane-fatty-acyl-phospholipid synthase
MSAVNAKETTTAASAPGLFARLVERSIPAVEAGRLAIALPGGETVVRTGAAAGPEARMVVERRRALRRILLDGEVGFVDGYLDGDWSTPDLPTLLSFLIANEAALRPRRRASRLTALRARLGHALRANTRRGSRRNIAAHYDLGNAFYAQWLDAGMNYSSALYAGGESLEAAQAAKIERVVALLELQGGDRVLEIGCGWGAVAERIAPDVAYTGVTLSTEQRDYARARLVAAGQVDPDVRLQDYRDVPERFDRIVSIEMFEAVGERYWPVYFDKLRAALAAGGVAVLQVITIAAARFPDYRRRPDFIQRHIFPGGMLPTVAHLEALAERSGLAVGVLQSFGDSYAETLREWRRRFNASWSEIAPLGFDERFRRMWDYYLAYCETGFRHGTIDVSLIQLRG